jgi:transcriptional regulator of heat shock response
MPTIATPVSAHSFAPVSTTKRSRQSITVQNAKQLHNKVESNRRNKIKEHYTTLGNLLGLPPRVTCTEVLEAVVNFISTVQIETLNSILVCPTTQEEFEEPIAKKQRCSVDAACQPVNLISTSNFQEPFMDGLDLLLENNIDEIFEDFFFMNDENDKGLHDEDEIQFRELVSVESPAVTASLIG